MLAFAAMPAAAQAGPSWLAPVAVSGVGAHMRAPQVVIDAQGDATVAWELENAGAWSAEAAYRQAGGTWTTPVALSPAGRSVEGLRLAGDQQGDASVVWRRSEGSGSVVESSFKRSGGSAWQAPTVGEGEVVEGSGTSGSGVSGKASVPLPPGVDAQNPQPFSDACVVWERPEGAGKAVEEACGSRDYRNAELITWEKPVLLSTPGVSAENPRVAANAKGLVAVVWEHRGGWASTVETTVRRYSGEGSWREPITISGGALNATEPDVAIDTEGDGVAVWVRSELAGDVVEAVGYDQFGPVLSGLSIPNRAMAGVPVSFTVSTSDAWAGMGQTLWGFGDALGEVGTSVTHTYKYPGNYDITITGTDALGNFTVARGSIYIEPSRRQARRARVAGTGSA